LYEHCRLTSRLREMAERTAQPLYQAGNVVV